MGIITAESAPAHGAHRADSLGQLDQVSGVLPKGQETSREAADRFLQRFGTRMLDAAQRVASNAYAPYTGIRTGCAVLTDSGHVHAGCTVENVAYPSSLCAIHCAVSAAVSSELGRQSRLEGHVVACVVVEVVDEDGQGTGDNAKEVHGEMSTGAALVKHRALQRMTIPGCCRQWLREVQAPGTDVEILFTRFRAPSVPSGEAVPVGEDAEKAIKRLKAASLVSENCLSTRVDCLSHVLPHVRGQVHASGLTGSSRPNLATLSDSNWFRMKAEVTMNDDSPVPPFLPGMIHMLTMALRRTYCPYSEFPVGAAVLTDKGVFTGSNVENEVLALGMCAEQTAIANAVASGAKEILAVVVACQNFVQCFGRPCGQCRQVIEEADKMAGGTTNVTVYACRRIFPDHMWWLYGHQAEQEDNLR
ncbi:putative cytidine deaminase [Neospora caninum Liverpool]|uniref:Putative cytidine deaminase n=1 Tax=Neospora caninum (strain Liverpool) TaxID=572307 RepID=F0VDP0_NEOCL|nr:putative cytidine deaminase [Neospora caninum Liverpool]CBZ51833.1 putative cytidine deaminase [Neospora caninum Liverpool]|eukprot:XP_003881866.1 putative cytidine deaminase [Neospora caninum Liverpool]